jgi:hypothetical protein
MYKNLTPADRIQMIIESNDINSLILLLKEPNINLDIKFRPTGQTPLEYSVSVGLIRIVRILLKDLRINPSKNNNEPIKEAFIMKNYDIIQLLWSKNKVKKSLKKDHENLYNSLCLQDFHKAVNDNNLALVKKMLKTKSIDPSGLNNKAIKSSYKLGYESITEFLWNYKVVEKCLEKDINNNIHQTLKKKYLTQKIDNF